VEQCLTIIAYISLAGFALPAGGVVAATAGLIAGGILYLVSQDIAPQAKLASRWGLRLVQFSGLPWGSHSLMLFSCATPSL